VTPSCPEPPGAPDPTGRSRPALHRPSRRSLLKTAAVGVGAYLLPLSGCSQRSGRTDIRFEATKVEVVGYFDSLVKAFNQSQSSVRATHDSTTTLIASFVRGNPPDLDCDNYNITTSIFLSRGVLSDLSDLPEAELIDPNVQGLVSQFATYKGQVNALPYSVTAAGVIYNVELFDKYGIAIPKTWTELIETCEKLKAKNVTPFYETYKDPWTIKQGAFDYVSGGMLDVAGFFKNLKAQGTDVGPDSAVSFERTFGPAVKKVLQLQKYANPDAGSRTFADGTAAFAAGKAAMSLQGPWAIGQIELANPKLKVGTFALPATDDPADTKCRVNLDLALWIPQSTKKREAAVKLLSYLMQPSVINTYNQKNLAYTPVKNAPAMTDDRISGIASYVRSGRFYQGAGTYIPTVIPIENYLQEMVLNGNGTAAMRNLDKDWRRLAKRSAA
jgi:raffinose/stachyose/melibiose transport system substrate-binding protein